MTLRVVTSCLGSLGAFKERLTLGKALSALIKGHIKGQMRIKKMKKRKNSSLKSLMKRSQIIR